MQRYGLPISCYYPVGILSDVSIKIPISEITSRFEASKNTDRHQMSILNKLYSTKGDYCITMCFIIINHHPIIHVYS